MSRFFQELAYCDTPMGALTLRRKEILELGGKEVFEVTLGDEFLMSSLFHDAEVALAKLGIAAAQGDTLDVAVGGLGLGYTAVAALEEERVASLVVIEALPEVIGWHRDGKVPLGERLAGDPRCKLVHADFFAGVESAEGVLEPDQPGKLWDAVLLDIDHTPEALLRDSHGGFYRPDGLVRMAAHIKPGGVFAMWSDGLPLVEFVAALGAAFTDVRAEVVTFDNPLQGKEVREHGLRGEEGGSMISDGSGGAEEPMRYGMVGGDDPELEKYMGEVGWDYLKPHFESGALLYLDPSLDMKQVGEALVADDRAQVEGWLKSGDLVKPSGPHVDYWESAGETYRALVVSPFVLMQPAPAPE